MRRFGAVSLLLMVVAGNLFFCASCDAQPDVRPLPGAPDWLAGHEFKQRGFTFVRIQFTSKADRADRGRWRTDYPDADLNLSALLGRMTRLEADPQGKVLKLTDPQLRDFPFIYMAEPGGLELTEDEVCALKGYLLGGGFLMVDDFWGQAEWTHFRDQIRRVFPDRKITELALEHPIFHCVFDLKERPQVPSIHHALSGFQTERADAEAANYRGILDDNGRMMVLICHNTDLADGWERSDVDERYYREFCEKKAYPMGINIVFFALTQ